MTVELFTFADESGVHGESKFCLVVGFIASPRQWILAESDWAKVLSQYKTTEFHAKDFFGRNPNGKRGLYDNWTSAKANAFLEDLLSIAKQHRLYPVGGAVDVEDFNTLTHCQKRFLTGGLIKQSRKWATSGAPSKPYYFAMNLLVVDALNHADPRTKVNFIFDEQVNLEARAVQTFRETVLLGPLANGRSGDQIKSISFVRSVDFSGIQLADMYSYAWNRYLFRGQLAEEGIYRILDTITPKRASRGPTLTMLNKVGFQKILNKLPKDVQEQLKADAL